MVRTVTAFAKGEAYPVKSCEIDKIQQNLSWLPDGTWIKYEPGDPLDIIALLPKENEMQQTIYEDRRVKEAEPGAVEFDSLEDGALFQFSGGVSINRKLAQGLYETLTGANQGIVRQRQGFVVIPRPDLQVRLIVEQK